MNWMDFGMIQNLVAVGFLWGITNPFIKRGTEGINRIHDKNRLKKVIMEIIFLVSNWRYMVPFAINQCGSILYYFSLKDADLTLAVPVCNSLAFVFTALAGWWLEEEVPNQASKIGMAMIAVGISCYLIV